MGQPIPHQILPQTDPPPVDLCVSDIRWQIAAEWGVSAIVLYCT